MAVDLRTGALRWNVPLGSASRLLPKELADKAPPDWGSPNLGGPIVNAGGLVFIGAALDAALHAFDIDTGRQIWTGPLPASGKATPMVTSSHPASNSSPRRGRRRSWARGIMWSPSGCADEHGPGGVLQRRFGLLQATALNMINMIGIGPFITIPLLMTALGGPQAMLGWLVALVIVICDGMIWSELGAAMPHSGGSFGYLREAFGRRNLGRLMAFLFVWQFILSGPLEIASGYIGFSQYLGYIWPSATPWTLFAVAAAIGVLNIVLLYRRITSIARITVSLWVGTLLTTAVVIVTGAMHFDPGSRSTCRRAPSLFRWGS